MFPIGILRFRANKGLPTVDIFDTTVSKIRVGGTATATYTLNATGVGSGTGISNWTWLLSGLNSDLQARATVTSGTSPSGDALSSWLSLNTTRSWSLSISGGVLDCTILVEIRRVVDSIVIDSATITIHAEVD